MHKLKSQLWEAEHQFALPETGEWARSSSLTTQNHSWTPGAQWGGRMQWLKHTAASLIERFLHFFRCRGSDNVFMLFLKAKVCACEIVKLMCYFVSVKKKNVFKAKEPLLCGVFSQTGAYTLHQGPTIHNKYQWYSYCKTRYTPFTVIITLKTLHCNGYY